MVNERIKTGYVLTKDGIKIFYDHHQNGFRKLVIIAHGFFNSRRAVLLQELGQILNNQYDVLLMDFRGHGQSEGLFYWTAKEPMDLEAILEYARPRYEKIGVIGFSLGAAAALIAAAKTNLIDSLVSISAPTEFKKIEYHVWNCDIENDIWYNLFKEGRAGKGIRPGPFWLKKDKPLNVVDKVLCPVMYIHGEADWLIQPWHSRVLHERTTARKDLVLLPHGPHAEYLLRENKNRKEALKHISDWFKKTL